MARTSPALKKYEEATAAYLHNLEHTGAAPLTVRNYASRLANFLAFWSRKNEVSHSCSGFISPRPLKRLMSIFTLGFPARISAEMVSRSSSV